MPIYQYRCEACGQDFSEKLKVSSRNEPLDKECPYCLISGFIEFVIGAPTIGFHTNPGLTTTANFNDRLKEIKRTKGKDNTIDVRGVS